jgi:hypothetical protein
MGFIEWIVVGLIAGFLAGKVMKGGGYGLVVDPILGILGGVLARWRHNRRHHRGICGRGDSGLDYPSDQESLRRTLAQTLDGRTNWSNERPDGELCHRGR